MIKKITTISFTIALCLLSYLSMTNASGPGGGYSDAPSESNCTSCHSGTLITSGTNWGNITLSSNFTGNGYIPDSTYSIKIAHNQSGISKWGFQITILDTNKKAVGTIGGSSSRVQLYNVSSRDYAGHTSTGTSSTGTNSTDWVFTWKAPSKNVGKVRAYVCINAADGDNQTSNDNIYTKNFAISPSSLLPMADAKSNDSVTCAGSNVKLIGNSTNSSTSWTWVLAGATPTSSTSQNPVVVYKNAGTFWAVLTAKNAKGVSKSDSLKIVVRNKPVLSISGPTSYTLCKGDSVKLNATINANYAYTWTPTGNVTQSIWAKDTGNYFVSIKNNINCTSIAGPVKISHHSYHTISISRKVSNDTICFEKPVEITARGSTTFDTIIYFNNAGEFLKTANNPYNLQLSGSNQISVKGKDSKGCISPISNSLNFVVKSALSEPKAICSNKSTGGFEIGWGTINNALGYQVSLDSGKTWENPSSGLNGLMHSVFGFPTNTDVLVFVKALDIFPCYESPINQVVCGSIPCSPLTYNLVWDKDVCKGSDINFKIRNLNTNFYSLKVDNGKAFKDSVFKITSDFSRTYRFELIDSANLSCPTIKRNAIVTVWEIPSLNITSNKKANVYCAGETAIIDADAKSMQEYNFFVNGVSKQKSNIPKWSYTNPKHLDSVWVAIKNGVCNATSGKIILNVSQYPSAAFTHSFSGKTASFVASEINSAKFRWDFGDGTFDTISKTPSHNYGPSGLNNVWVKLKVINDWGCETIDSAELNIPASIGNMFAEFGIFIYPQPAQNSFKIEIPADLIGSAITITDLSGRTILALTTDKNVHEIVSSELQNGLYLLNLSKGGKQFNGKVLINR